MTDSALEGRGTSNFELEFRTKSSEIRYLLVNATTRRDSANNVVGVVCVAQDVTESVQRDRAVAGMALELRQLIDTANAPIFGIDIDGNVNEWNKRTQVSWIDDLVTNVLRLISPNRRCVLGFAPLCNRILQVTRKKILSTSLSLIVSLHRGCGTQCKEFWTRPYRGMKRRTTS
jgi:hypothetical protein